MKDKTSEDILFDNPIATYNTLIVCVGNTCRSVIMHSIMEEQKGVNNKIFSAGTKAKDKSIMKNTVEVLKKNNVKLAKNIPQKISDIEHSGDYDRLIVLDEGIKMTDLVGVSYRKLIRMDIHDPEYDDIEVYDKVFEEIKEQLTLLKK